MFCPSNNGLSNNIPQDGKASANTNYTDTSHATSDSFGSGILRQPEKLKPVNYGWDTIKTCTRDDIVKKRKVYKPEKTNVVLSDDDQNDLPGDRSKKS